MLRFPRCRASRRLRAAALLLAVALLCCRAPASLAEFQIIPEYIVLNNVPQTDRPLGLPEGERVDDSYFNRSVFVGDSVSAKLRSYVLDARKKTPNLLGDAQFLTVESFSARLALKEVSGNSYHPSVNGVKMTVEDALYTLRAKKLFIMFGMNDVGISGVEGSVENMMTLLGRIRQRMPDLEIYVQSATPRLSGKSPDTQGLFEYDLALYRAVKDANDPKMYFVDVTYIMRDSDGRLIRDYCVDANGMALHFTNKGCRAWIDYLYTHTS